MEKVISMILILLCCLSVTNNLYSQPLMDTTLAYGWSPKGVVSLNLSQIALENWVQGGDNSLSFTSLANFGLIYYDKKWELRNQLKVAYGRTKTGDKYVTNDNELRLTSILMHNLGWKVNPYFSNEFRTQLANGFDYKVEPAVQISAFFDPGYITQALGFVYTQKLITTRLGIALQETFTKEFNSYSDDPETVIEIEKFKLDTGLESVTESEIEFLENMIYTGRLRLFSRFNSLDVWDVNWENIITAKVNDLINVNLGLHIIYEKKQSVKTQLKQYLQLGFSYILF